MKSNQLPQGYIPAKCQTWVLNTFSVTTKCEAVLASLNSFSFPVLKPNSVQGRLTSNQDFKANFDMGTLNPSTGQLPAYWLTQCWQPEKEGSAPVHTADE